MRRRIALVILVVGATGVTLLVLTLGLRAQAAPERASVAAASAVPGVVSYQGYLTDSSDQPIDGTVTLEFGIYAALGGGSPIWDETHNSVSVSNGYFNVLLGSVNSLNAAVFAGPIRYLQVAVNTGDGPVTMPRQQLAAVPYAFQAQEAANAWSLNGNGGTTGSNFLGTADNVTLTLKVSDTIAMRIAAASGPDDIPNLIGGFKDNRVTAGVEGATIGGGGYVGHPNWVDADFATIAGGSDNWARGEEAAIGGGTCNLASGAFSAMSGGICNEASGVEAFVGGGSFNDATGDNAAVGGGSRNKANGDLSTIGGGDGNIANGALSTVGGGDGNFVSGESSAVGGGRSNSATGLASTVSGGSNNNANALTVAIGGGTGNSSNGGATTIAGGQNNTIANETAFAAIGGGTLNLISGTAWFGVIGGGRENIASDEYATVGGGYGNIASASNATVSGGNDNIASGSIAAVGGGSWNNAGANGATIPGGFKNIVGGSGDYNTIGGGQDNVITGTASYATIPGGVENYVSGQNSFAAGSQARVEHAGTFVWADSGGVFTSTADNQFLIRAANGVGIGTNSPSYPLEMGSGAHVTFGGVWTNSSDREKKENFSPVDSRAVLAEVATLPITQWNYKANPTVDHIGPVAQDFYAAFRVGNDDRAIGTVDADGVALAAIQGLYEINQEQEAQIDALERQNAELEARLQVLEKAAGNGGSGTKTPPGDWLRTLAPLAGLLFVGLVVQRRRPWLSGR